MMIVNSSESHLVSHLGWVDKNAVLLCETASAQARRGALGDARYLSLHPGRDDLFAAVHHFDGNRLEISAHRIAEPDQAISRIVIAGAAAPFEGDSAVRGRMPPASVAYP